MTNDVKQLIIVRNDLRSKLRHGKLAAQVAHAAMAPLLRDSMTTEDNDLIIPMDTPLRLWLDGAFTKVVLRCDDLNHMKEMQELAIAHNIRQFMIHDAGRTVFNEPTYTCLGVGPFYSEKLNPLYGDLKMY